MREGVSRMFGQVRNFKKYDSDSIIDKIHMFDTISFDIFDTIIKRSVDCPSDIFEITAIALNQKYGIKIDPVKFKKDRQVAEAVAKKKAFSLKKEEITLIEIYNCLDSSYALMKEALLEIEIQQEKNACYPNRIIKRVYDWCVENKKRIILISDMYLPLETIRDILEKCGFVKIDKIYLSSDIGKTKRNGSLFDVVRDMENSKTPIVHIGDNLKSDYIECRKRGIHPVLISKAPDFTMFSNKRKISRNDRREYKKLKKILSSQSDPMDTISYKYGFECEGPLLYGFSSWLYRKLIEGNYDKVYFMARDGYLMKKVYETMFPDCGIKSYYLHVSRRSVHVPLLWMYPKLKDYLLLNGENKKWNIINLANRLGIDIACAKTLWEECGLKENYSFKTKEIDNNASINCFFEKVKNLAYKNSRAEYIELRRYLGKMNFSGRIAIVDSGGNATTQRCLMKFLENEKAISSIKGFYLWCNTDKSIDYEAFPISTEVIGGETVMAELPLTSPEGTVIRYNNEGGKTVPLLDEYEFEQNETVCRSINDIQTGCLKFAKIMMKNCNYLTLNRSASYHNVMMMSRYPRLEYVKYFGEYKFRSDKEDIYMAKPRCLLHYVLHPSDFLRELKCVKWKMGFLKRLFIVPLPYYELVCLLRKV